MTFGCGAARDGSALRWQCVFAAAWLAVVVAVAGCSSATSGPDTSDGGVSTADAGRSNEDAAATGESDAGDVADAGGFRRDAGTIDKAAGCAATFGNALTTGFGRLDGTVVAVVPPGNERCAFPNRDHLVLQVAMRGAVYRMVVNVASDRGDGLVYESETVHALPSPAFSPGWHPDVQLDYVVTLGLRADAFTPMPMDALVRTISDPITIGANVSVYATSGAGRPESAHLVHRNALGEDGAIVIDPDGPAPRFYVFRFGNQSF